MFSSIQIGDDFRIIVDEQRFTPPSAVVAVVDDIWQTATRENQRLFDGISLSVVSASNSQLQAFGVPYRFFYAQHKQPELQRQLNLKALGVSGLVAIDGQIIVGRRSASVTEYPDCFELVPSGSLPAPGPGSREANYREQLKQELFEEVGIAAGAVESVNPRALFWDGEHCVYDIFCTIRCACDIEGVLSAFRAGEYSQLFAIAPEEIEARARQQPDAWVPTTLSFLQQA